MAQVAMRQLIVHVQAVCPKWIVNFRISKNCVTLTYYNNTTTRNFTNHALLDEKISLIEFNNNTNQPRY